MNLNDRLSRALRGVKRWRSSGERAPIAVSPGLTDKDWQRLAAEINATVEQRGGPVAARRRAGIMALTYRSLDGEGRRRFLHELARHRPVDNSVVDEAIDAVLSATSPEQRRAAEGDLRSRLEPASEILFHRLIGIDGGLPFLIELRSDLLDHRADDPWLANLDRELRRVLESRLDVGLLKLERLTWNTPASFLEKLIEYEAVHAIESWDDLKHRLGELRRCYAFVHPGMPDDPLIFVEVALTDHLATSLEPLLALDPADGELQEQDVDTAIFYSISNCHRGLAGVALGEFLIKSVVEELTIELPRLTSFATLSPLPGFRRWLSEGNFVSDDALNAIIAGPLRPNDDTKLDEHRDALMALAARYLTRATRRDRAADPVAHFHLSNGAGVERLNWMANPTETGWERGLGIMVNYRYDLSTIETNHDRYVNDGVVAASTDVTDLLPQD